MAIVGEAINDNNDICGVVISRYVIGFIAQHLFICQYFHFKIFVFRRRAADRIAIWNSNKDNCDGIMALGKAIKEVAIDEVCNHSFINQITERVILLPFFGDIVHQIVIVFNKPNIFLLKY